MGEKHRKDRPRLNDRSIFDLLLLGLFVLFSIVSLSYNPRARSIPLGLGIVGGIMILLQFLADFFPAAGSRLRFLGQRGFLAVQAPAGKAVEESGDTGEGRTPESDRPADQEASWGRVFRIILWLGGFVVLLMFTHYLLAVGLFILFLTKIEGRESWIRSGSIALGTTVAFYLLFEVILNAHL
jgi:hypothetical protein